MYIKMLVFDSNGKLYATVVASNEEDYFAKQNEFKEFVKHYTVGQSGDYIVTEDVKKTIFSDNHRRLFKYDDLTK